MYRKTPRQFTGAGQTIAGPQVATEDSKLHLRHQLTI
jgi:hypothetical protein